MEKLAPNTASKGMIILWDSTMYVVSYIEPGSGHIYVKYCNNRFGNDCKLADPKQCSCGHVTPKYEDWFRVLLF